MPPLHVARHVWKDPGKAAQQFHQVGFLLLTCFFSVQGNCRSSDTTGGRWCYVEGFYCDDIQYSKSRRDRFGELRKWSYQACSTPAPGTGRCGFKPIKPVIVKPVKPVFVKPVISKPVISKPVISKPVISKPVISKPIISKPVKPTKPSGIFGGVLGGILKPPKKPTITITKEPRAALKTSVLPEEDGVVFGQ